MSHTLVLLRHGESDWNAKNLFTGWVDVDLTDKGRAEAVRGGEQLKAAGLLPDAVSRYRGEAAAESLKRGPRLRQDRSGHQRRVQNASMDQSTP